MCSCPPPAPPPAPASQAVAVAVAVVLRQRQRPAPASCRPAAPAAAAAASPAAAPCSLAAALLEPACWAAALRNPRLPPPPALHRPLPLLRHLMLPPGAPLPALHTLTGRRQAAAHGRPAPAAASGLQCPVAGQSSGACGGAVGWMAGGWVGQSWMLWQRGKPGGRINRGAVLCWQRLPGPSSTAPAPPSRCASTTLVGLVALRVVASTPCGVQLSLNCSLQGSRSAP